MNFTEIKLTTNQKIILFLAIILMLYILYNTFYNKTEHLDSIPQLTANLQQMKDLYNIKSSFLSNDTTDLNSTNFGSLLSLDPTSDRGFIQYIFFVYDNNIGILSIDFNKKVITSTEFITIDENRYGKVIVKFEKSGNFNIYDKNNKQIFSTNTNKKYKTLTLKIDKAFNGLAYLYYEGDNVTEYTVNRLLSDISILLSASDQTDINELPIEFKKYIYKYIKNIFNNSTDDSALNINVIGTGKKVTISKSILQEQNSQLESIQPI